VDAQTHILVAIHGEVNRFLILTTTLKMAHCPAGDLTNLTKLSLYQLLIQVVWFSRRRRGLFLDTPKTTAQLSWIITLDTYIVQVNNKNKIEAKI